MKQDLEKAEMLASSFTSKKSKALPGTLATARKSNGKNDYQREVGFSDLSEQQALMVEVTIPNCYKQAIRSQRRI
ncbi:hypothetical protein TNCV_2806111 [Trichonephila clavipes]|nr:hypothetical protein TNCV_2806111 [Trichonephila clavipes]